METMKSEWGASRLEVQVFAPNEFVASCAGYEDAYKAKCRDVSCLIFFDDGNYTSDANRGGCGQEHIFRASSGDDMTALREGNCWVLPDIRSRQPGTANANSYVGNGANDIFARAGNQDGTGWTIKPTMIDHLKATNVLVRGYYNSNCLGGGGWLVTDDLQKIVPAS